MIRLPTRFKLLNRTYEVEPIDTPLAKDISKHGDCDFEEARIRVEVTENAELTEHTFFHELVHALLIVSTKPKLTHDEKLVDSIAAALHQYEQTKKGNLRG